MTKIHIYAAPLLGLATLAALGLTARPAAAQTTISFNSFDEAITNSLYGYVTVGPTYSKQGFTFTTGNKGVFSALGAKGNIGDGEISFSGGYGYTSLTQDNGLTFNLSAIDLGPLDGNSKSTYHDGQVTFTGTKADGTTVIDAVEMTSVGFQEFDFTNLTDLKSLTFIGAPNPSTGYSSEPLFDNVVLTSATSPTASPAPEPSQMAGLGLTVLGLGGLLLRARKRKACESLSA